MKTLLLGTALASLALTGAANAASYTFGNLVITQIPSENTGTFDNNPVGATSGFSTVSDWAYSGSIYFVTDGAVAQGLTPSVSAPPAGDASHYLFGVNGANGVYYTSYNTGTIPVYGALVEFSSYSPNSFNIYWGSIDALTTSNGSTRYDNVLSVFQAAGGGGVDTLTGSQLVAAGVFGVNGFGDQSSANDNQWFNVRDLASPILGFSASSADNAFEFDMAVPEASTWAMMGLGFAGLAYAGLLRSRGTREAVA